MGNAQAIPIIGEVLTVAEAAGKTVAAGCCAVVGDTEGSSNLINSAGKSFENYVEVGAIGANIHLAVAAANDDQKTVERLRRNQEKAWEGIVDSTPVVGHVKGAVHYAMGDSQKGDACMIGASRSMAVAAACVATAGAGALVCGSAALVAGSATDGITTGINSACKGEFAPTGIVASVKKAVDSEGNAVDVFDCIAIPVGDFAAGAMASRAAKARAKAKGLEAKAKNVDKVKKQLQQADDVASNLDGVNRNRPGLAAVGEDAAGNGRVGVNEVTRNRNNMPRQRVVGPFPEGAPQNAQPVHVTPQGIARAFEGCAEFQVYERMAAEGMQPQGMVVVQKGIQGAPNVVRAPCGNCADMHANGVYGNAPLAGVNNVPVSAVVQGLGLLQEHIQNILPAANAAQANAMGVAVGAGAVLLGRESR